MLQVGLVHRCNPTVSLYSHHATLQYPFYSHHATRGTAEPVKGQMGDLDKLSFSQELVCMRQAWGMHNVQVCL